MATPKPRKPREYEPIWLSIKAKAANEPTSLRVHHSAAKTLIQGVRKEKSWENAIRRKMGMTSDGKLQVSQSVDPRNPVVVIIKFTLAWSYRDL